MAIADLKQAIAHHQAGRLKDAAACYEAALFGEEALVPGLRSRGSASALAGCGLKDWTRETEDSYVSLAVEKAADIEALAELRSGLRELIRKNPIGDHATYARAVEAAYRQMWRKWCRGT